MADPNIEADELSRLLQQVNEDMRRFGRITAETSDALAAGSFKRAEELKKAGQLSSSALTSVAGAASAAAGAMLQGQKGTAAFNSSLDNLTAAATAAGAALTFLIPGGPVIKALVVGLTAAVGALTAYTKAANQMADDLYKGYSGLAKSGAAAADGMTGVFEDAKKLGLSMNELGDFVNIVGANSKDMALFAGTVFDGRKRLAEMGKALEGNRQQFLAMGLSMTEVTEGMAGYLRLQTRIGQSQNKTTEQLADGARKYLIEQDLLTKLTGLTRQEQEQAREAALSEQRFAAKLEILRQQGRDDEADAMMTTNLMLSAQSKEAGQGFRDISTNMVQTEAAQKLLLSTQGEGMRAAQRVAAGQIGAAEATERIVKAIGATAKALPSMGLMGTFDETYINFGDSIKMAGQANRDFVAEEAKAREQLKKQREGADPMLDQQSKLINTQIQANEATERFVNAGILPAQQAMITLAQVTRDSASAIAQSFGIKAPEQKTTTDIKDEANFAAATLPEKIESGLARGVEAAGRGIAGLVGLVSDKGKEVIDGLVDRAQQSRVKSESEYLAGRGRAPGAAPGGAAASGGGSGGSSGGGSGSGGSGDALPAPPGEPQANASGPGQQPTIQDYIKFTSGTGSLEHFSKLHPNVAQSFLRMARDYNQVTGGKQLQVNSSYRSPQEQAGVDPGANPKAAPGMSLHQHGRAIDIQSEQVQQLERLGLLANYRFKTLQGDPPHIYMRDGGVVPATPGGVNVTAGEAGQNEAFVPLPDGNTIPVSVKGMNTERLIFNISELTAKLKLLKGVDNDLEIQRNMSQSFQTELGKMVKLVADSTQEAMLRGVDVAAATQIKPLDALQDLAQNMLAAGGITQGPSIAGEAGPEAVVPLPDGKTIPVSINLRDVAQTGPTFAGMNEYKGYNQGPMSTDLDALKDIAGSLGAYDAATETITDPAVWKEILKSGMLMNYDVAGVQLGTKLGGPDIGIEIGERIQEVMAQERTDLPTALKQVKDEFAAVMREAFAGLQTQQDPETQAKILEALVNMSRSSASTADASQRMAQAAMN